MPTTDRKTYIFAIIITVLMGHNMILIKSLLFTTDALVLTFLRMVLTALTLVIVCYFINGIVLPTKIQVKNHYMDE